MYECLRFASIASAAGLGGTSAVLDYIVMTKLLPKVHGSRQRLETPLLALNAWTAHYESGAGEPFLPRSAAKLSRMIETLKDAQFVTFTE
jgi:5-methylcytosine-specific restriction protein B